MVMLMITDVDLTRLFQHGAFDGRAVIMASESLTAFAIGIAPFMLVKVLASGFYARQDMRTPVKIGVVAMLANIALNFALISPLKHAGIALATSLAAIINMSCLYFYLYRCGYYTPREGWGLFSLRLSSANLALAGWIWFSVGDIQTWIAQGDMWRILHLAYLLVTSAVLYFAMLWIVGIRLHDLLVPQKLPATH